MFRFYTILISFILTRVALFADDEAHEDLFLSTPEQVAALSSEPSYLIAGLISPLSGQPVLTETDIIVKGAQNIVLSRTYIAPHMPHSFPQHKHHQEEYNKRYLYHHLRDNYKGWQFYPHIRLEANARSMEVRLSEPSGMTLDFRLTGPGYKTTELASSPYGMSNVMGDEPSGKYDPRNTRIMLEFGGNKIRVLAMDGTIRLYRKSGWMVHAAHLYLLEREILRNGKILKYNYSNTGELQSIESLDPKERYQYGSLSLTTGSNNLRFVSSSDQTVDYGYQSRRIHWKIKEKQQGEEHDANCPPILTSVSSPFYRHESLDYCGQFLLSSYGGKEKVFQIVNAGFGNGAKHFRVQRLLLPVGQNDAFVPVYELSYKPPFAGHREGTTTLRNSDGTSVIYHFSKNLLTSLIQYFDQDGGLKKEKIYTWDENQRLKALEMQDSEKHLLYRKSYEYDSYGNPILEKFTGDLTGEGNEESYTTRRLFSQEGKNLLLKEETEEGKVTTFSYLPSTALLTSKLIKEGEKILLREFWVYDDCHNLIQNISDDGSSEDKDELSHVTQRKVTNYRLRQTAPFLHMPEWVEESYLERGMEKLLKKSRYVYDRHGNVAEEEIYDAEGRHAYTIYKTYNERGDVLTETNRLGQQAVYTYDAKGHLEGATNFSNRLQTTLSYDAKGRVKQQIERGDDQIDHTHSFEYDFHDRKIQKKDPFQNVTHYAYDPVVSAITRTDFPSIASLDGKAVPVSTLSNYDSFGRELTRADAGGNVTRYCYNAYGSPTEIIYPGGGRETFRYTKSGKLSQSIDLDGLATHYKQDILGRTLSKIYISAEGEVLAKEIFTYSGFNLLTETGKEGNVKKFSYDGAGRKIREEFCGQITEFSYDLLGWLATICKHNGENSLFIHYTRDLEGQVLEECKMDRSNHTLYKINYSYDSDGNRETITRYINGTEAIDTFKYDPFRRLIERKDAMGHTTRTFYNESYTNRLGQKVLQTATLDPRSITSVTTQDALLRTVKQEILNPNGSAISTQEIIHDAQGNLIYRKDHVYENDHLLNIQTIKYSYTPDNQLASLTRAFGTKDARTTTYTQRPSGKIATKTLPDGVTLAYSYHPLGFLSRLDSSDGMVHHLFEYDLMGRLRSALDENRDIAIKRKIDPFGNVVEEVFPYGFEVKKEYDNLNRLASLKMGTQGEVHYTYDPLFLRTVTRSSSRGQMLYAHHYDEYDEDGNLISEKMIGDAGQIAHRTDARGQKQLIASPYFSEQYEYDPVGNLIGSRSNRGEIHYSYDGLSQLTSESSKNQLIYTHDSLYNRIKKNGAVQEINELNELLSSENIRYSYDLNGNQIIKQTPSTTFHFTYDPLQRLIEAVSETEKINFSYDPLGRRLSKVVFTKAVYGWKEKSREYYLYDGQHEIGAFSSAHEPINLRVLGGAKYKDCPATVGVEIEGKIFAPHLDVQGNIRRLIDPATKTVVRHDDFTAFGIEQKANFGPHPFNPWGFASKRIDPELGLIYFGKRYYDPPVGRWLTTDPAGFVDSSNLYQYVFNNPFRYVDQDGQFIQFAIPLLIWGAQAALPALSTWAAPVIYGLITGAAAYGGYKAVQSLNKREDNYSAADDYAQYVMQFNKSCKEVRTEPKNLEEQLALEEANAKPQDPEDEIMQGKIKDPRYSEKDWKKVEHIHERPDGRNIDIHYWENRLTGEKREFKFKND